MIETELLDVKYCWKKSLEHGSFFTTAIEFDPDNFDIDGELIRDEICELIEDLGQ